MNKLGIDFKILLGQIINFVILLYLLKRFAFKPFLSILERRKQKIEEGVKNSEDAARSLGKIRDLAESSKRKNEENARELMIEAEIRAKARAEEIMLKVDAAKKKAIEEAKAIIQKEDEEEKKKREREVVERTFILTEKLLKEKLDEKRDKKIIEDLIAGLK